MPNLKDLKDRIGSVKSTQKITKAMKMVAATKLRKAHERAQQSRPYADRLNRMMLTLLESMGSAGNVPELLIGRRDPRGKVVDKKVLLILVTSDRGLCGGFNSSIVREAKRRIAHYTTENKEVKLMIVGKKGKEQLQGTHGNLILETVEASQGKAQVSYADARAVADKAMTMFEAGEIDQCQVLYNHFVSAMTQNVTLQTLIPLSGGEKPEATEEDAVSTNYIFEPEEEVILEELLPRNISMQVYRAMLESAASEQGARMTAMDNATRNAGDMIDRLTLQYNRTRQAAITTELVEIISGAEAL